MEIGNSLWTSWARAPVCTIVVGWMTAAAVAQDLSGTGLVDPGAELRLGPVPGWTLGWHAAPETAQVPAGVALQFEQPAASGAAVHWVGAVEVARDAQGSTAVCTTGRDGLLEVSVTVQPEGATLGATWTNAITLEVTSGAPGTPFTLQVQTGSPLDLLPDEPTSEQILAVWFGPSIASVSELAEGAYLTSIGRPVAFLADSVDEGWMPLLEWRVDGAPVQLGGPLERTFHETGLHRVEVGPPAAGVAVSVMTYAVNVLGQLPDGLVLDGVPTTFGIVTDPPGFEHHVTWIASTKFGMALPLQGQGPVFTTAFLDSYHPTLGQWLGVKADQAALGQDQGSPLTSQCKGTCALDADTVYSPGDVMGSPDLHVWDVSCKAGGHANLGELVEAICDKFDEAGRKITVFVDGHGCQGVMSVGAGTGAGDVSDPATSTEAEMEDDTDLSITNAPWLRDKIKDKVTEITLFGCSTGGGADGQALLDELTVAGFKAKAYSDVVCANGALTTHKKSANAELKEGN